MRFIAEITDPDIIRTILALVGEATLMPPVGRARAPRPTLGRVRATPTPDAGEPRIAASDGWAEVRV